MEILRLTRHEATPEQLEALRVRLGEVEFTTVSETLPGNPREAVARFDELAKYADVAEVVLPIHLLEAVLKFSQFSKRGGTLIRAVMNRELDETGNAIFTFDHYEKVVEVNIVTEPL